MKRLIVILFMCLCSNIAWAGASRLYVPADSDSLNVSSNSELNIASAWTVACWVKRASTTSSANDMKCLAKDASGTPSFYENYWIRVGRGGDVANGEINVGFRRSNDTGWDHCSSTSTPLLNTNWNFLVGEKDGSTVKGYVNGTEACSVSTTNDSMTGSFPFYLGRATSGYQSGRIWDGNLAFFMVYNRALTAAERNDIQHHPCSIISGLVGCWYGMGSDSPELNYAPSTVGSATVTNTPAESSDGPPIFLTSPLAYIWNLLREWFLPSVWADDVVLCAPTDPTVPNRVTSYQRATDPAKDGTLSNPNALIWTSPLSNSPRPWDGVAPPGSSTYWKCVDTNADTLLDDVVEMTPAEKTALDAPTVAEAARQQAFTDEVSTNTFCSGELSDIGVQIDTAIDTWVTTRQAEINGTTNFATLKTALRDQTIPAIGTILKTGIRRVARCVRARAQ